MLEKSWWSRDSNLELLGGEQERFLCATQPPPPYFFKLSLTFLFLWDFFVVGRTCHNNSPKSNKDFVVRFFVSCQFSASACQDKSLRSDKWPTCQTLNRSSITGKVSEWRRLDRASNLVLLKKGKNGGITQ